MIYHVLPGDSLAADFRNADIEGEVIVCREALVAGDKSGNTLEEFWEHRASFIALEYGGDPIEYQENVAYELERLIGLSSGDEVHLWFEYELFCQANMWFCLDLLRGTAGTVFRVQPKNVAPENIWKGFSEHTMTELADCYEARTAFSAADLEIGSYLWQAFRNTNAVELLKLGEYRSPCFPFLREVCEAAAEIDTRPSRIVRELRAKGLVELDALFPEFRKQAGVYGFGDLQVQRLLEHLES